MKISDKRKAFDEINRSGTAQKIINLAFDICQGNYKNAVEKAGRIAVIVECLSADDYWNEKANIGRRDEEFLIDMINKKLLSREKYICMTGDPK